MWANVSSSNGCFESPGHIELGSSAGSKNLKKRKISHKKHDKKLKVPKFLRSSAENRFLERILPSMTASNSFYAFGIGREVWHWL